MKPLSAACMQVSDVSDVREGGEAAAFTLQIRDNGGASNQPPALFYPPPAASYPPPAGHGRGKHRRYTEVLLAYRKCKCYQRDAGRLPVAWVRCQEL